MMTTAAAMHRVALVYNPIKVNETQLKALVASIAEEAGWSPPLWLATTVEDAGQGVTRQALDEGVSAVLVAGGDGTVRAVAEAVADSGVTLGIIPSGTGNLFARNLGLPLTDPAAIIRAAI
ncbi:MAG TPA: diacylglycerol kinase family protein, partial [Microbacterium sp.]|nr:diacylglycerol kinase family protein [Microbacterium sp.]